MAFRLSIIVAVLALAAVGAGGQTPPSNGQNPGAAEHLPDCLSPAPTSVAANSPSVAIDWTTVWQPRGGFVKKALEWQS